MAPNMMLLLDTASGYGVTKLSQEPCIE